MKPRDIFGLAVRLLGLVFLYLGLRAVTPLLDMAAIETASKSDIVNALLPVIFDLAIAWWLLGGRWLMRRAYPETLKAPEPSTPKLERAALHFAEVQEPADMDPAEKKLAPLVERPKENHAA